LLISEIENVGISTVKCLSSGDSRISAGQIRVAA
jgi:hypothetical protein